MVDDHTVQSKPETNGRTHILKADWFWYTIQNGYANEMDYQFGDVSFQQQQQTLGKPHQKLHLNFPFFVSVLRKHSEYAWW